MRPRCRRHILREFSEGADDRRARAIVREQRFPLSVRIGRPELSDVDRRSAPESIDRLSRIRDDPESAGRVASEQPHKLGARGVDVLVLVDQVVRVLVPEIFPDTLVFAKQKYGPKDEVSEVEGAALGKALLINPIGASDLLRFLEDLGVGPVKATLLHG